MLYYMIDADGWSNFYYLSYLTNEVIDFVKDMENLIDNTNKFSLTEPDEDETQKYFPYVFDVSNDDKDLDGFLKSLGYIEIPNDAKLFSLIIKIR